MVTDGRPFVIVDPKGRPLSTTTSSAAALVSEMLIGIGWSAAAGAGRSTTMRTDVASDESAIDPDAAVATEFDTSSARGSADIKPITRNTAIMALAIAVAKFLLPASM